jgi:hypothetical protein
MLAAAALAALLAGCTGEVNQPAATLWEADISGAGMPPSELMGSLGAVSRASGTEISISITGAEPQAVHPWQIRTGSCGTAGQVFGAAPAYPDLHASNQGGATVNTIVSRTLDEDGTYQVVVLQSPSVNEVIACGDLELASF